MASSPTADNVWIEPALSGDREELEFGQVGVCLGAAPVQRPNVNVVA